MNTEISEVAALLAKMRSGFIAELPERCQRMEASILALERGAAGAFDELYRQIHSLKGSGGTFSLPSITAICHQFEEFIGGARNGFDAESTNLALSYVDLLRRVATDNNLSSIDASLERLRTQSAPPRVVLLVEPSAAQRRICQAGFAEMSIRLESADDGSIALARLRNETFDLLILSREISGVTAIDVLTSLRQFTGPNRTIPVLLVSSNLTPAAKHLDVRAIVPRNTRLLDALIGHTNEILRLKRP